MRNFSPDAPTRRQAIIWANGGWRIYASLGLNELIDIFTAEYSQFSAANVALAGFS